MLLVLTSVGLLGIVAYKTMWSGEGDSKTPNSITETLNQRIDNGYRFRDITYTNQIDLAHPDVINNQFYHQGSLAMDRGDNAVPRQYVQLYPGCSEITQLTLREHLYL